MPPRGKGRKRTCDPASLVDELRREVDSSLAAEDALLGAFRVMCTTKLTLDGVRALPPKVLSAHLYAAYESQALTYISFFVEDLRVLPVSVRLETLSKITGLAAEEASLLFESVNILKKSFPDRYGMDPAGISGPILLCPPTATCFQCSSPLALHNKPCDVAIHGLRGKAAGLKFSLRCESCRTNYSYDRFGDRAKGWSLYPEPRPFVEASDVCFIERKLLDVQCALANHSWVSFSGFSTAYNEAFGLLAGEEDYGEKHAASAFWNGELETELRDLGKLDFFGLFKINEDREKVMEEVDKVRAKSVYSHSPADCSDACKARGCGRLWVVDGQWKLMFAHCMMQRKNFVRGLPLLNYPNVCTNSPKSGKAFCEDHLAFLSDHHPDIPTDIRGFLRHCGIDHSNTEVSETGDSTPGEFLDKDVSKVDDVISSLGNDEASRLGNSAVEAQGNSDFIGGQQQSFNAVLDDCIEPQPTTCNKDTGSKQRLQKWSRGHLFIVRGGGIIDKWSPLFKSESPSQVFIIILSWLFVIFKSISPANWAKTFVAYDNMCHLDGMKAAKNPLPLPSPWDKAWICIKKIIDSLHIKNHKDKSCREKYDPSILKEELPDGNTMAAEQTFVWLSRFKKILCAMPKVHHLFYLHRMVKRRNQYTIQCYKNGKKPLLPRARGKKA